jgi:hypothetical protein
MVVVDFPGRALVVEEWVVVAMVVANMPNWK